MNEKNARTIKSAKPSSIASLASGLSADRHSFSKLVAPATPPEGDEEFLAISPAEFRAEKQALTAELKAEPSDLLVTLSIYKKRMPESVDKETELHIAELKTDAVLARAKASAEAEFASKAA